MIDFEAGLRLVQERGAAMQDAADATPSGMVSILGLDRRSGRGACANRPAQGEVLEIANLLCPGNIVDFRRPTRPACERPKWRRRPAR